jgi:hypothetical protein
LAETEKTIDLLRTELREIAGERLLKLRKPLSVQTAFDGEAWVTRHPDLGILAFGDSPKESLKSFAEDFEALYDEIHEVPDKDLTPRALMAKRLFADIVESTENGAA